MGNDPINKNLIRESILELLSDEENARVARAEGEVLIEGDEYIDLSDVASGVHQVHAEDTKSPYESVLPRSAVKPETWSRILARIG